jgi:hypothetical protein
MLQTCLEFVSADSKLCKYFHVSPVCIEAIVRLLTLYNLAKLDCDRLEALISKACFSVSFVILE